MNFKEFTDAAPEKPPQELTEKIFKMVHQDLNPNSWLIFAKMGLIHLLTGMVTLSLCPQFGFRVFGEGLGLMKYFLHFGEYGCTVLCGSFFVGASVFTASIWLRPEELKTLRYHRWLQVSGLTFLSLGAFLMLDSEIIFGFAVAWAVGSVAGGVAMLELGRWLKFRLRPI